MENKRRITHEGEINLGGFGIDCYVLEDGTRVLTGRGMESALKMVDELPDGQRNFGTRIDRYLAQKSLEPFIYREKERHHYDPIECYKGTIKVQGYEASLLVDICDAFLEARKNINLSSRQAIIAEQCEILVRGFARVGLVALIDEATGYQYEREHFELQKILRAYISDEVAKWQLTFTDEFYKEIYRLWNLPYTTKSIKKRPQFFGTLTNKYIYEQLPYGDDITKALKEKSEPYKKGGHKYRFHQWLTAEIGREALKRQIHEVTTLMKISDNKDQFHELFQKRYSKVRQLSLLDDFKEPTPPKLTTFDKQLKTALEYKEEPES